jgi:hypothetical protein
MRSSKWLAVAVLSSVPVVVNAARVDFKDPKRALGREDDVRVDAELANDTLSSTSPISITYQIENLSKSTVAIADKVADSDYDPDSQTITLSIGAEIPKGTTLPHMVMIKSGEKCTLTSGTFMHVAVPDIRTPWTAVPRYVQIKVTLLRDVAAFAPLIAKQATSPTPLPFPNNMFDRWVEGSGSVYLNSIPIQWKNDYRPGGADSDRPPSGGTY